MEYQTIKAVPPGSIAATTSADAEYLELVRLRRRGQTVDRKRLNRVLVRLGVTDSQFQADVGRRRQTTIYS